VVRGRHPVFFFFLLLLEPFEVVSLWGDFPAFFIHITLGFIFLIPFKDSVILKNT
jgi:hypothetical protein